jgi:hypothetical protein
MPTPITNANPTMPLVSATQMPQASWKETFLGRPAQAITTQRYTPGQQGSMNWARQMAQQQLSGNQFDFAPIEQAARTGFTSKTIPSIMERFTAMGGAGTAGSSALQGALGSAGAGLEEQLAAMKQQYNLAREPLLQNLLGMGMQQQYDTSYQQRTPGLVEGLFGPGLQAITSGLGLAGGFGAGMNMFGGSGAAQGVPANQVVGPYSAYNPGQSGGGNAMTMFMKLLPFLL